jgi:hypothetical protein
LSDLEEVDLDWLDQLSADFAPSLRQPPPPQVTAPLTTSPQPTAFDRPAPVPSFQYLPRPPTSPSELSIRSVRSSRSYAPSPTPRPPQMPAIPSTAVHSSPFSPPLRTVSPATQPGRGAAWPRPPSSHHFATNAMPPEAFVGRVRSAETGPRPPAGPTHSASRKAASSAIAAGLDSSAADAFARAAQRLRKIRRAGPTARETHPELAEDRLRRFRMHAEAAAPLQLSKADVLRRTAGAGGAGRPPGYTVVPSIPISPDYVLPSQR